MGQPITTTVGICFAFPDVCQTLVPGSPSPVPVPYPNIGQLSLAAPVASSVLVGGNPVVTSNSEIETTTGDEAGSAAGPGTFAGKVVFKTSSQSVNAEGNGVVRMFDTTEQNNGNAVGTVLGGVPNVLVG